MIAWVIFIVLILMLIVSFSDGEGSLFLIIVSIIWICVFGLNQGSDSYDEYKYEKQPIYSVFNRTNTEGDFFLGTGTASGEEYYYVMIKEGQYYTRVKYSSSDVLLKMDDCKPHIKHPYNRTVNPPGSGRSFWWTMWNSNNKETHKSSWWHTSSKKYILVVPHNTIREDFYIGKH